METVPELETKDVLTFLSSVVGSISWPVAIVILAFLLRKPLSDLLPYLRRIRYGDVEFNFGSELQELEGRARTAGLHIPEDLQARDTRPRTAEDIIADAIQLVEDFPEPAVGVAWLAVEHELMQAVMRLAISADYPPYNAAIKNISLLYKNGHLDDDTRGVLDRMRRLRNATVHVSRDDARISAGEARHFVALAGAVTTKLKGIT